MAREPRIALVTCAQFPALFSEEGALIPRLRAAGVSAEPVVWSDDSVDWRRFDAVVLRSTWDYFERIEEFRGWLSRIEALRNAAGP